MIYSIDHVRNVHAQILAAGHPPETAVKMTAHHLGLPVEEVRRVITPEEVTS